MPDNYEIHSLHINVGNGDGAIHLLVEPGAIGKQNIVHRAILVDGGKTTAVDQIQRTIKYIEDTYQIVDLDGTTPQTDTTLATPVPQLRFDGIVVSRWAIDHSAGVLALINQRLLQDVPDLNKPRQDSRGNNLGPCAFMRYDAKLAPLTTFYSAFWDGPTGASLVASTPRATSQQAPPTSQIKLHAPTSTSDPPPAPPTFSAGDANGASNPRIVDFVDSNDQTLVWPSVCTLVATPVELIGREMFTGSISQETDGTALRYYADVSAMAAALKDTVTYTNGGAFTGICCIGADGTTVSKDSGSSTNPSATPPKNSSIALVGIVGGVVKHYFAGDADYRDDNAAADWINASVPVMKLGNHGSVVSAPLDLVTAMKPKHFICSVGPSLDYLHPRWELLLYLKAWADSSNGGNLKNPFFHPTNYPVYFTAFDSTVTNQLEFEFLPFANSPTDDSVIRFQGEVTTLDSALVTIIQDHAKNIPDGPSKTRWAIDFLRNLWPFMSYSTPDQHPIAGAKATDVTVSQQTQILFIMAQLTKDDPVISYVNGGRKVVSKSTDSPKDPNALGIFNGYDPPPAPVGPRKNKWFTVNDTTREDTAPGGVILQKGTNPFTGDAISTSTAATWTDKDDETPDINLTTLIANGAFPESTPATPPNPPGTAGPAAVYFLGVPAYDAGTTGSDTEIVVSGDINTFISGLGPGFIGAPAPDTSGNMTLTTNDIWGYYMSVPFLNTEVTITKTTDSTKTPKTWISGISMLCKLFGEADDKKLMFSTANNVAQFNNSNADQNYDACGSSISNDQVAIPDTGVVVCGLDTKASLTSVSPVTFKDVMSAFNFASEDDSSTLWKMINFLEKDSGVSLNLTLLAVDPAFDATKKEGEVYRNAIWCFADTLFRFTIRLSFAIDPTIENKYLSSVANYLNSYLGISGVTQKLDSFAKNIRFEVEMTGTYHPTAAYGYEVKTDSVLRAIFPISLSSSASLEVTLTFSKAGFGIDIGCSGVENVNSLVSIAANLTGNSDIENAAGWLEELDVFGVGGLPVPDNVWISKETGKTEYGITFYFDALTNPVVRVGLSYNSSGVLTGALILPIATANSQKLLPDYNLDADPMNPQKLAANSKIPNPPGPPPLKITALLGGTFTSLPNGIPDTISEAWVEYTHFATNDNQIRIFGSITSDPSTSASQNIPAIDIQVVSIAAQLRKKSKTDPAEPVVNVSTTVQLNALPGSNIPPAVLNASLNYDSGDWLFHGRLESFQFSVLSSHFPAGVEQAFDDVLGKFFVKFVDITYTYDSSPERSASSFFISGAIHFGGLELDLAYQYVSSATSPGGKSAGEIVAAKSSQSLVPPNQTPLTQNSQVKWQFDAWLGAVPGTNATVGSVLDSIDSSISSLLPAFVTSTPIPSADSVPPPISIEVKQLEGTSGNPTGVGFRAWVHLGDISMTFIQKSERLGISSTTTTTDPPVKRILRISVATLPTAEKIPLVNELPQPFDTLEYMWVSTPDLGPDGNANPSQGFTTAEVTDLNTAFLSDYPPILVKATTSGDDSKTGNDPSQSNSAQAAAELVLVSGHHFRVIHNNEVILDYPFGEKQFPQPDSPDSTTKTDVMKPAKAESLAPASNAVDHKAAVATTHIAIAKAADTTATTTTSGDDSSNDAPVAKGPLGKTIGPLTISNIGVKLDSGFVWLTVDATIVLGPLSFDLLGFGVGFDLKKADKGLSTESIEGLAASLQVQLHGMGLGFENPPITIAGVFNHDEQPGINSYSGGVAVGFPPYTLVAVGEYDEVTNVSPPYKSVFIFAKLDGPLVELEFASIEGIRLGFGYNNIVVTPDLAHLTSFPFISDSALGTSNDPMKVLVAIQATIQLQDGALWLAAGMSITAFDILKITAVALVEFSKQGCDISLFCDGMASMPPDASPSLSIVYVEVVMIIELNISQGFFRCEAALAPTSFILVPQCHLMGGFALCYWFTPSPYAGDFVFTIGGYHRSYSPPAHYPVPDRIGFSCKMGSNLAVTGESYFAVTPTCCMGGGHLHVQINVGPVSAYLDAYADFLITYKPFHYLADMGVDVGVTFDADWWIVHIHISCHIGAHLHLEGPEFGGEADVEFYLFGFTVYFGASPSPPPPLLLDNVGTTNGFYQICKLPGPGAQPNDQNLQNSTADPQMSNLHITLEAGAYTQGSSKTATSNDASNPPTAPGTKWKVRAGTFRFRITCVFAISSYTINNEAPKLAHGPTDTNPPAEADIFAFPMHCSTPITSDLTVFIVNEDTLNIPAPTTTDPDAVTHVPSPTGTSPALTADQLASITNFDEQPYQPDFIIKSVPKALWAAYDSSLDPTASNASGLLAGNKATPTVDLAMGITVGAPLPLLSQDKINFAFNALDAMRANVFGAKNGDPDGYDPSLPASGAPQSSWLPQPAPDNGVAAGWTEFQAAWTQSAEIAGILSACASTLGWDSPPPDSKAPAGSWVLNGTVPADLKSGLGSYYLVLPQIGGAT